ncbi:MAG: alpha/beta hydrolase [Myxococcales bacterium]|nr:alpha/beta hydrolase [Myxococcales bacterium]
MGDTLARRGNGLATTLGLIHNGREMPIDSEALRGVLGASSAPATLAVFVHGLMCTETIWDFPDGSGDYGSRLARDVGAIPLRLRYNSGLPIPDNGAALDAWLSGLVAASPRPIAEIVLVGYSMGGLVVRAACHTASLGQHAWLQLVRRCFYVGTPHRGAPLERAGRLLTRVLGAIPEPTTRLVGELADLRSAGLKDLGDADLRHEERARPKPALRLSDAAHPVPLLPEIHHTLLAGTLSAEPWLASLFGDSLVPVPSGTFAGRDDAPISPENVVVFPGMSHVTLAHDARVYDALLARWGDRATPTSEATSDTSTNDRPPVPGPSRRLRGLLDLATDVVEHGSRAVQEVHEATAARPFDILTAITAGSPALAAPTAIVRAVHDASVASVYASIRLVNAAVSAAGGAALDLAHAPRDDAGEPSPADAPPRAAVEPPAPDATAKRDEPSSD